MNLKRALRYPLFLVLLASLSLSSAVGQNKPGQQNEHRKLIVGVMSAPPYSIKDEDGTWTGITIDLWKEIALDINVDYEFKELSMSGVLSGLADGSLDLAATGLSITAEREEKFDFSDPYLAAIEAVAVNADQQPAPLRLLRNVILNWTVLGFILFVLALTTFGASVLWLLEHKGESDHYAGKTKQAFGKSMFWSTMVLCGREFPKAIGWSTVSPSTTPGKFFGIFWMTVGIMLISLFTATMASVLTSKELQGLIRDANDLHHVNVGTIKSSVAEDLLRTRHIRCNHLYNSPQEMMDALAQHKVDAVVYNRHIMIYYARTMYPNKIEVLRFPLRQDFLGIPMRTASPLKEKINSCMMQILENKTWNKIVSNYLGNDWTNADQGDQH